MESLRRALKSIIVTGMGCAGAVAIAQQGSTIKLAAPVTGSEYVGTLSADRNEIVGTLTTAQGLALPLTLRRQ